MHMLCLDARYGVSFLVRARRIPAIAQAPSARTSKNPTGASNTSSRPLSPGFGVRKSAGRSNSAAAPLAIEAMLASTSNTMRNSLATNGIRVNEELNDANMRLGASLMGAAVRHKPQCVVACLRRLNRRLQLPFAQLRRHALRSRQTQALLGLSCSTNCVSAAQLRYL